MTGRRPAARLLVMRHDGRTLVPIEGTGEGTRDLGTLLSAALAVAAHP